jgi:cytochrome c oxidase subunit 3
MKSFFSTLSIDKHATAIGRGISQAAPGGNNSPSVADQQFEMRLRRDRLGLLVGLIGVSMIFISFTSAYIVRQGLPSLNPLTNTLVRDWFPLSLPGLLFVNTFVLLLSSGTMEMARRQIIQKAALARTTCSPSVSVSRESGIPWLALTVLLGFSFLIGQWTVWRELAASGVYVSTNPSSSFVYLLTGTHGVHLLGGIVALVVAGAATFLRRPIESRAVVLDITGWYWHFMAVLWVYILCLLEFAR